MLHRLAPNQIRTALARANGYEMKWVTFQINLEMLLVNPEADEVAGNVGGMDYETVEARSSTVTKVNRVNNGWETGKGSVERNVINPSFGMRHGEAGPRFDTSVLVYVAANNAQILFAARREELPATAQLDVASDIQPGLRRDRTQANVAVRLHPEQLIQTYVSDDQRMVGTVVGPPGDNGSATAKRSFHF